MSCNLVLDADQFRIDQPDAAVPPDAPIPDGPVPDAVPPDAVIPDAVPPDAFPDANEANLTLTAVTPGAVPEGLGSSAAGPGALVVIEGGNIAPDAVLTTDDTSVTVKQFVISTDGNKIAAVLGVGVDPMLPDGMPKVINLVVTQNDGNTVEMVPITIEGLDSLAVSGTMQSTTLKPLYASITLDTGTVTLRGTALAQLRATGDIVIGSTVDASGAGATTPGAGGCTGGGENTSGQCAANGGGAGSPPPGAIAGSGGAGGGGGASAMGENGSGGGGTNGTGGAAINQPRLAKLGAGGARGHGGGGGGNGKLLGGGLGGNGGAGGAGGGVIELQSAGQITISASVRANGGPGAPGTGGCGTAGGGGGGGSGGAILVRAAGALLLQGGALFEAKGGTGGLSQSGCPKGGNGSPGWIRLDAPAAISPTTDPADFVGPMWAADTAQIVSDSRMQTLAFHGGPAETYGLSVNGANIIPVTTNPSGAGSVMVLLDKPAGEPNELCLYVATTVASSEEEKNCRTIVYLP